MNKFSKILVASILVIAMCAIGAFSAFAYTAESILLLGANTVEGGTAEEPAEYVFEAPETGNYTITVDGTVNYQIGMSGAEEWYLEAGETVTVRVYEAEGDVTITVDMEPADAILLFEGENPEIAINGCEGTMVMVIASASGRYTITSDDPNVDVGVVTSYGVDYEVNYADATVKGETLYFVIATKDFTDTVATLNVEFTEPKPEPATALEIGENKDVAVDAEGTIVMVIPTAPGRYTVTTSDEKVLVGVLDTLTGNINYEVNYVDVATKGETIYFVLGHEDFIDVVVDVTVERTDIEPVVNTLEVDQPHIFSIDAEGIEITVTATKPGRYTIKGEGIKVGVITETENGIVTDWEVSTLDAKKAGETLVFVVALDDDAAANGQQRVELSVAVSDIPVEVGNTGDSAIVIAAVMALVSVCGIAIVSKKRIHG